MAAGLTYSSEEYGRQMSRRNMMAMYGREMYYGYGGHPPETPRCVSCGDRHGSAEVDSHGRCERTNRRFKAKVHKLWTYRRMKDKPAT